MPRTKYTAQTVCGDCGSLDATWASLNKGILLCTQCCSVHRSLGRHISLVKSLQKSTWYGKQLNMLMTLNNHGVNSIWEHTLLENNSKLLKKKPNPVDSLEVKSEFIRAKHQQCLFALRQNSADGPVCVENELGKQLHASVRSTNLETSFRLLTLGSDPNYFHDEKGTTPLHVAVKSEQQLQLELLLVYGADPTCPDSHGQTAVDYAKNLANKDIYNRLLESQYDVTDTLSYYLAVRKPDHQNGVHFLIPQNGFYSNQASLEKLQKLPNHLFEELVIDVFDEVDRRQTEAIWLSCSDAIELSAVPFLPVDPTLSTTRNQGRQKLARFTTPELKNLVYDILIDTQRRQMVRSMVEEDPVYDTVASDEDYAIVATVDEVKKDVENSPESHPKISQLTKQLRESDSTITDLKAELHDLKSRVVNLTSENQHLKTKLSQIPEYGRLNGEAGYSSLDTILMNESDSKSSVNGKMRDDDFDVEIRGFRIQRPSSMYELNGGRLPNWQSYKHQVKDGESSRKTTHNPYSAANRQPIVVYTDNITKSVQQLWKVLRESNINECILSAEKVKIATAKLIANLPRDQFADITKIMLDVLPKLQPECKRYVEAYSDKDPDMTEHHLSKIREYAYVLVSNTRDIVTKTTNPC